MTAFDKNSCELYELFGVIEDALDEKGYAFGANGSQAMKMYDREDGLFFQVMRKDGNGAECPWTECSDKSKLPKDTPEYRLSFGSCLLLSPMLKYIGNDV